MATDLALRWVAIASVGFFLGSVNPAYLLGRMLGVDVRGRGSGNPGATNAGRVLGVRWGAVVLLLDVLKGAVVTLLAQWLIGPTGALVAGAAAVLGHMFSPFLRGRGGKGVATTFGALLVLHPLLALSAAGVLALGYAVVRFVGVASAVTSLVLVAAGAAALVRGGELPVLGQISPGLSWWCVGVGAVVALRHRRNLLHFARQLR